MLKRATLILTAVLAGGLARPALAEGEVIHADLSFPFTVGAVELPAGHYEVRAWDHTDEPILTFKNTDTGERTVAEYVARIRPRQDDRDRIVFDRVGNRHYLTEIHLADADGYLVATTPRRSQPLATLSASDRRSSDKKAVG